MEQLQVRILIKKDISEKPIAYLYSREAFELLKVKENLLTVEKSTDDNSQLVFIGDIIEYDGKRYLIKNINFKMFKELEQVDNGKGSNMYSPTDSSDYNCQIGVFVDNA